MAPVLSEVEGVTLYAFTVPSILTATLCTPSQSPSTGARVPVVVAAVGFSPVAVKVMGMPSGASGSRTASSCVQAAAARSRASAENAYRVYRFISSCFYWFFCNTGRLFAPSFH